MVTPSRVWPWPTWVPAIFAPYASPIVARDRPVEAYTPPPPLTYFVPLVAAVSQRPEQPVQPHLKDTQVGVQEKYVSRAQQDYRIQAILQEKRPLTRNDQQDDDDRTILGHTSYFTSWGGTQKVSDL